MSPIPSAERTDHYDGDYMEAGRAGEEVVMRWLRGLASVDEVTDLRHFTAARYADVDVQIRMRDGRIVLSEIKSDRHLGVSDNILFEVLRINHTAPTNYACGLGWAARSPASSILYYAPAVSKIYHISTANLRLAFQRYTKECRGQSRISWVDTDATKSTLNVLIPIRYAQGLYQIFEVPRDGASP